MRGQIKNYLLWISFFVNKLLTIELWEYIFYLQFHNVSVRPYLNHFGCLHLHLKLTDLLNHYYLIFFVSRFQLNEEIFLFKIYGFDLCGLQRYFSYLQYLLEIIWELENSLSFSGRLELTRIKFNNFCLTKTNFHLTKSLNK